ncbi:hypothetical protein LOAG_10476 [Loa loa]|uniref:Uncharacterized protein n=2 Tax=Loa loa TaxID=7209 RepID=A0A1S0TPP3_LOALO|nr:hypothetical protein LOAG_10476 [Loa loa]EFO18023.1 hypothetical protein LOAG_10476 [Loa loa]
MSIVFSNVTDFRKPFVSGTMPNDPSQLLTSALIDPNCQVDLCDSIKFMKLVPPKDEFAFKESRKGIRNSLKSSLKKKALLLFVCSIIGYEREGKEEKRVLYLEREERALSLPTKTHPLKLLLLLDNGGGGSGDGDSRWRRSLAALMCKGCEVSLSHSS